ncbi:hypothetical protein D1816_04865 [Aquimarina sp. AD10]|uniref:hypothetical protein n=1 Tax=Aquimarina sp. AD10 TaxID=1714849 RepID=UPI000E4D57F9|nr:hypothetical protein [Aquimarina sp. AD10]AXT59714.1 hypothetical protein D1816_04865 [Aquimarina sp. AD10]RKM97590.1 hypothetical protein D7033_14445 [Aquimarina sp. AD10]
MKIANKPPIWFWIIAILALLWNIMGVLAYLAQAYITDEAIASLPEAEQSFYNNMPAWVTAAFAIAVFAGALGCILLLLRKKIASILFILSLIGIVMQTTYNFFLQDFIVLSGSRMVMPILVLLVAIFLIWFSKRATVKAWIS